MQASMPCHLLVTAALDSVSRNGRPRLNLWSNFFALDEATCPQMSGFSIFFPFALSSTSRL